MNVLFHITKRTIGCRVKDKLLVFGRVITPPNSCGDDVDVSCERGGDLHHYAQ